MKLEKLNHGREIFFEDQHHYLLQFKNKWRMKILMILIQKSLSNLCTVLMIGWSVGWLVPFSTTSRDLQDSMFRQQTLNDRDSGAPTHETASPMMRIERSCSWRASLLDLSREDEDIEDEDPGGKERETSTPTQDCCWRSRKEDGSRKQQRSWVWSGDFLFCWREGRVTAIVLTMQDPRGTPGQR
jgi:hypothetical protein